MLLQVIFHLADAPCHGRRFHNGCGDNYPEGDKLGRDISRLLRALQVDKAVHKYSFSHIYGWTKKMVQEFRRCSGGSGSEWIIEDSIGTDTSKLKEHVVRSISGGAHTTNHNSHVRSLSSNCFCSHRSGCATCGTCMYMYRPHGHKQRQTDSTRQ
jgi:hypothetical protein